MKKLKKVFVLAGVMMLAIAGFAGCGGEVQPDPDENPYTKTIDAAELAEYLFENITFYDELNQVDKEIAFELYGIEPNTALEGTVYMSTGATAEEIAVFTVSGEEAALLVSAAYEARIEDQKRGFENYVPEEIPKLENAFIVQIDSAVVMIVCNDVEEAETAVNSYIAAYLTEETE